MKNNKGFTLIEALIVLGLVSIGSLALAKSMINMNLSQNYGDFKLSTNALAQSIFGNIFNPTSCSRGFSGIAFNPTGSPIPMTYTLPNKVLAAGVIVPNYNLIVSSLNFINYKLIQTNTDGSLVYFGDLALTTKATRKVLGPNLSTIIPASIYVTAGNNVVIGCGNVSPTPTPIPIPSPTPSPTPTGKIGDCDHDDDNDHHDRD